MSRKAGYIKLGGKNIHFIHLILMGFALFIIVYIAKGSFESAYIAKKGIETKGKVVRVITRGSKGVKEYYYQFSYKTRTFSGKTLYLTQKVGDELDVIFIKDDPSKNRDKEGLKKTYNFFLKNNPNLE